MSRLSERDPDLSIELWTCFVVSFSSGYRVAVLSFACNAVLCLSLYLISSDPVYWAFSLAVAVVFLFRLSLVVFSKDALPHLRSTAADPDIMRGLQGFYALVSIAGAVTTACICAYAVASQPQGLCATLAGAIVFGSATAAGWEFGNRLVVRTKIAILTSFFAVGTLIGGFHSASPGLALATVVLLAAFGVSVAFVSDQLRVSIIKRFADLDTARSDGEGAAA